MGFHVASVRAALLAGISLELLGLMELSVLKTVSTKYFVIAYYIIKQKKYNICKTLFYKMNDNVVYFVMQKS